MKIYNTTNLTKDGSPISRKNEQNNTNPPNNAQIYIQPFGQPSAIQISNKGRDMQKKQLLDQLEGKNLGIVAKAIYDIDADEKERKAKLEMIADLEKKMKETTDLTNEDKENLQKDIDRLKKETETDEDRLRKANAQKQELSKKLETAPPDAELGIRNELKYYAQQIAKAKSAQMQDRNMKAALDIGLVKENAEKDAREMKEKQANKDENKNEEKTGTNALDTIISNTLAPLGSADKAHNNNAPNLNPSDTTKKTKL